MGVLYQTFAFKKAIFVQWFVRFTVSRMRSSAHVLTLMDVQCQMIVIPGGMETAPTGAQQSVDQMKKHVQVVKNLMAVHVHHHAIQIRQMMVVITTAFRIVEKDNTSVQDNLVLTTALDHPCASIR